MRAALVLALLALPLSALAGETRDSESRTAEAKARFKQGVSLYKQSRWGEAVEEFETAYRLKPHGVVRFNIAQCYEKLGQVAQALKSYHLYLREVPEAEDKAAVQTAMAGLEKSLSDRGLQQLLVFAEPAGAEVSVDGQVQGRTPWSGELPLGKHQLSLSLPGYEPQAQEVELAGRSEVLQPALKASTALAPPPLAQPVPVEATAPAAGAEARPRERLWTWVVGGAAAASLIAAVGCGIAARSASNELRGSIHDQKTAQSLHDRAASNQTAANVLYGLGAAAGVAGGVLYFTGTF